MATEQKIVGPWEQDERGGWKRVGINGIPWAEVWPRGYAGYGWAVSGGAEGLASDAVTSDGNLTAAKRAADDALTAGGCGLIAEWPTVGHTVRLPRPFDARRADFLEGLRALTKKFGVAVELHFEGYSDSVAALQFTDASGGGEYEPEYAGPDAEEWAHFAWRPAPSVTAP